MICPKHKLYHGTSLSKNNFMVLEGLYDKVQIHFQDLEGPPRSDSSQLLCFSYWCFPTLISKQWTLHILFYLKIPFLEIINSPAQNIPGLHPFPIFPPPPNPSPLATLLPYDTMRILLLWTYHFLVMLFIFTFSLLNWATWRREYFLLALFISSVRYRAWHLGGP